MSVYRKYSTHLFSGAARSHVAEFVTSGPAYSLWVIFIFLLFISCESSSQNEQMNNIKVGSKVPSFSLPDQNGNTFNIDSVLGKKNLVIYFYPKDDSPGCTKESCSFRDEMESFNDADALVIGISGQSVESHKKFADKYNLKFTLLSDEGNKVRKMFGVPANLFGLLPGRVTYIVNKSGKVDYLFNSQTQATKHVEEALKVLQGLN